MTGESWYANADALTASDPEETISYTYNADGDITSESDFNCAQSAVVSADYYTYNDADQLTAVVETIAGGPAVQLVYTYNDAGECSGVTASIGGSVDSSGDYSGGTLDYQNTYGYDANGDLIQIIQTGQTGGDAVATKEIDLTYNAAGQFQSITRYENGQLVAESDYTYNAAGQLTNLVHEQGSSNVLASYAYTYGAGTALASAVQPVTPTVWTPSGATLPFDDPSQIDLGSLDQAPSPASLLASVTSVDGTATYSYDAIGQLTAASCTGAQPNESYSWDANGNPTGSGYVIGPDNELLSDGTYNYTYNADGDCTSRTDIATGAVTDYTWDARNRLVGVTDETSADQITQTVTYVYDVENRCISETVTAYTGGSPTSVHTTDFAYDGNQIVLQFDATSTPGTPVTLTTANLSHRYLSGPAVDQVLADERVTVQNGALATDEVLWPLADAQGTVRDVAKLNGTTAAVVDHVIYNSFGGVVSESDPSQGCLFKSTGCFTDPATDIEFHEERDKIAGSVDWLKVDPSGFTSGTTNLYGYCGESPTNFTDPSGLDGDNAQANQGSWDFQAVVDMLKACDAQLGEVFEAKGRIVGDAHERWLVTAIFTQDRPWVEWVGDNANIGVGSIIAHVDPTWTSAQVAKFIVEWFQTHADLRAAIENAALPFIDAALKQQGGRPGELAQFGEQLGGVLKAGVKVAVSLIPGGIAAVLVSDIAEGAWADAILDLIPAIPVGKIGTVAINLVCKGGKEVKIVAPVVKVIYEMAPEEKAALKAELQAAKTAEDVEVAITKVARSAGYDTFYALKQAIGSAGVGKVWHHIVEQCQEARFGAKAIQTYSNVVAVSIEDNIKLNTLYSRIGKISEEVTGSTTLSIREWLATKTFAEAQEFGKIAVQNVQKGIWP